MNEFLREKLRRCRQEADELIKKAAELMGEVVGSDERNAGAADR
jgi:hypothetical protein